jgi:uncharacterized short protein YbdD (DUF466 family)
MRRVTEASPTPARLAHGRGRLSWWRLLRGLPRAWRRVLGAPDYASYLEHCRRAGHAPEVGERAYLDAWFAARGRSPHRCC